MAQPHGGASLDVVRSGKAVVVRLPRRVAEGNDVQPLGQVLFALAESERPPYLVVSLAAVEESGSALLGRLIMLHQRAEAVGGRLALCRLPAAVREALAQTRLAGFFHVYDTEEAAVRSF